MRARLVLLGGGLVAALALFVSLRRPEASDGRAPAGPAIPARLIEVARGFEQVTDLQFFPGEDTRLVVLEKGGVARWLDLASGARGVLFERAVYAGSEMGLLGLAFHPDYRKNGRFFVNYNPDTKTTHVAEWELAPEAVGKERAVERRVLLEVDQPYRNHDGGQVAFGPDRLLYVALGDGGSAGDPKGHGQNPKTLLGKMLRIDVDGSHELPREGEGFRRGRYGIPKSNPWLDPATHAPEIYALGLRNPWRFSFDPAGRAIVADVGQNLWEEVSIVEAGKNYGWKRREGAHCFPPASACDRSGLVDPVHEYGRDFGNSVTGGYVALGARAKKLRGLYVFADFGSGRFRALGLPSTAEGRAEVFELALPRVNAATFGRSPGGDLFVADFATGQLFRIETD